MTGFIVSKKPILATSSCAHMRICVYVGTCTPLYMGNPKRVPLQTVKIPNVINTLSIN